MFSNIRIPSPITARNPRVLVPISCCDEAADHLISVLGGEEGAKKIVGGIKWWQASPRTSYKPQIQTHRGLGPRHQGCRCSMDIPAEGLGRSKKADPATSEIHAREGQKGDQRRSPCGVIADRAGGALLRLP
jgi:hypothetical protein